MTKEASTDNTPKVTSAKRVSPIWIVPLLALSIAAWLAFEAWRAKGPEIRVVFDNAAGIEVSKTHVRFRDVVIGEVTGIKLSNNFEKVTTVITLDPQVESLISEHTSFWVVAPRISLGGVSGLDTLLSGVYIEMDPGKPGEFRSHFEGLREPPSVRSFEQGTQYVLISENLGSLDIGSPVYHRQIPVGAVTRYRLLPEDGKVEIRIFINAPHDKLIRTNTKFWNVSGIGVEVGANGIVAKMETLTSLVSGGLAFHTPPFINSKTNIANSGRKFYLFTDKAAVAEGALTLSYPYLVRFNSSVRGLVKGASVEFRGIQVGKVEHVGLNYGIGSDRQVNVVISLQPERIDPKNIPTLEELNKLIEVLTTQGMRAQLKSKNILTGSLFVDLLPNDSTAEQSGLMKLKKYNNYLVIPSSKNQQLQIIDRVSDIAKRIEQLPFESIALNLNNSFAGTAKIVKDLNSRLIVNDIDKLLASLNGSTDSLSSTIKSMKDTLEQINQVVAPDSDLHYKLTKMLEDVSETSISFKVLTETLTRNPNALLLGRKEVK